MYKQQCCRKLLFVLTNKSYIRLSISSSVRKTVLNHHLSHSLLCGFPYVFFFIVLFTYVHSSTGRNNNKDNNDETGQQREHVTYWAMTTANYHNGEVVLLKTRVLLLKIKTGP